MERFFPFSTSVKNGPTLFMSILLYLVLPFCTAVLCNRLSFLPLFAFLKIVGTVVVFFYSLAGIIISLLYYFKILH